MNIFKKYDIRGVYPDELNEGIAFDLGRALGTLAKGKEVYVNHDTRIGSLRIKESFIDGLVNSGSKVKDVGLGPIMVAAFASFREKTYGVCITASHNPKQYTGILPYKNGVSVAPSEIERIYKKRNFSRSMGNVEKVEYNREYARYVLNKVKVKDLAVGVDAMGGAGTEVVVDVLRSAGVDVKMLHSSFSSDFYGKVPEPSQENASELASFVKKKGLDFGFQLDGDADRVLFVDDKGGFVDPMYAAMVFITKLKMRRVVANVACSSKLEKLAKVKYVPVGRPFIEKTLLRTHADLGVEASSHFYFNRFFPFSDGILGGLLMSEILGGSGRALSDIVDALPRVYMSSTSLSFEDEPSREKALNVIYRKISGLGKTVRVDGIKVLMRDGFILVRKSNTEPLIEIAYEGKDVGAFRRMSSIVGKIAHGYE